MGDVHVKKSPFVHKNEYMNYQDCFSPVLKKKAMTNIYLFWLKDFRRTDCLQYFLFTKYLFYTKLLKSNNIRTSLCIFFYTLYDMIILMFVFYRYKISLLSERNLFL
ncbi:hypothetical protein GDO86_011492 [Hymenochirus boettgeri]|uniref:Uncharacterized protein n=1 Tax=Hymenochirus boettgeri TaxID=247094 RepID=A0A8T2JGL9_9PIPI|nr:hypothetical protein GDO86_011492 [Hymenochirus boettgeri]